MGAVHGLQGPDERPANARGRAIPLRVFYRLTWWLMQALNLVLWRIRTRGTEKLPKKAPFLLLPNHSAALDPFWVGSQFPRPCSFMAATSLLMVPVAGRLLAGLGAFPKQKFVKDNGSMAELERRYGDGEVVVLFPEGDRTWDGRTNPVPPGIGRLIKRLRPNVVYARMHTAHLTSPRWATRGLRWIPNYIEYDGPYHFPESMSAEEITAHVIEHIAAPPRRDRSAPAWGTDLAHGLPELLWACPSCLAVDGLDVDPRDGSRMACGRCDGAWRVDLDNVLHSEGAHPTLTVAEARDRIAAHYGHPPILDRAAFEANGVVMQDSEGVLLAMDKGKPPVEAARGQLRLTHTRLSLLAPDGAERWGMDLLDLDAFTIEVRNQMFVRSQGKLWRLEVPSRTRLRWGLVTSAWHMHHKPLR